MLKGIKVKPKQSNPVLDVSVNDTDSQSINKLIISEKSLTSSDYNFNLLTNIPKSHSSDYLEEPDKYSASALNSHKQPVTLKTINCEHCIDSKVFSNDCLISIEDSMHISLPIQGPLLRGHFTVSPNSHVIASTEMESDEFEDLQDLKRKIMRFYREQYGKKAVFVEFICRIDECNHTVVDCFPVNTHELDDAYATVMHELSEADDEWTDNRKIVSVGSRGIQEKLPKGFPYVYFDFNMERGLAHVIENHKKFKKDFVIKMLAETLGLDPLFLRRKTSQTSLQILQSEFQRKWSQLS